ncbi:hypothetical protein AMECASPLE_034424 [Ameca splendens]|uniref:G-protein coupled receptors family 1 profile domain-containing protein n=1 Tax=Ameca splendens TaxID=208324 RepID=A0ABV0Y7F6_9TELE
MNRYMKIFHCLRTSFLMTARAARSISVTTRIFFLVPLPVYIILMLGTKRTSPPARTCDVLLSELAQQLYIFIHAAAFVIFLSVLFSLVFFYYSISRRVLQIQQRRLGSSNSKKLVTSRRNVLVLISVFCICFVPYHLVRLLYVILRGQCSMVLYYLKEVTILISVFNICLDPLIYVFLCKDFRAQVNLQQMFSTTKDSSLSVSEAEDRSDNQQTQQ